MSLPGLFTKVVEWLFSTPEDKETGLRCFGCAGETVYLIAGHHLIRFLGYQNELIEGGGGIIFLVLFLFLFLIDEGQFYWKGWIEDEF